jgi:ferredoxin-NADP reductase
MKVTLKKRHSETNTIETFWFEPDHDVQYIAGQYIELSIPHEHVDQRGSKRWFTLSSSPTDTLLSITTKFAEEGSSFKKKLHELQPGTVLDMAEPMGDFVLPKDTATPLVFVAGGMGITPFHSIFKWLADTGEKRSIRFLYAVRTEEDIIFQDTVSAAHVHATITVTDPSSAWGGERGTLTGDHILKLSEPNDNALIYLSGPEPMIESLEAQLIRLGINKQRLVSDFFPGYEPV